MATQPTLRQITNPLGRYFASYRRNASHKVEKFTKALWWLTPDVEKSLPILNLETTHPFMSGPTGLAVLIGQQLNRIGPVQTYEHLQDKGPGQYAPAILLPDSLTEKSLAS